VDWQFRGHPRVDTTPDWLFEVKHDGFRALAHITGHQCELNSRNGHAFKHWPQLCQEVAHAIKARDAILDGEIVCLDKRGRSNFKSLLFRRDWPFFYAFDLVVVDGEDHRAQAATEPGGSVSANAAAVRRSSEGSWQRLLRGGVRARQTVGTTRTARAPTGARSRIPRTRR
jgi:ATP dependent DNA ligase-like protein